MTDEFTPKAYVDARLADQRYYAELLREADRRYVDMRFTEFGKATEVAFQAATEKGIQHNGVLEMLQKWVRTTITWPIALSCLVGAGVVASIYENFVT